MSGISGLKSDLVTCYRRGQHLMSVDKNYDYAHALFAQCVTREPSNLAYSEALLQNLREKFSGCKKKSVFRLGSGGSRALKKAQQQQRWPEMLRIGIDRLSANPWDVTALRAMAEASAALHHNEVELVYLKQALDADPKSIDVNCHCAHSLGRMGQFDQAIACWHRVEKLRGKDVEAERMICRLAEEKLRYPNGRPPATTAATKGATAADELSSQPQLKPSPASPQLHEEARVDDSRNVATEVHAPTERIHEKKPFTMPWRELLLVAAGIGLGLQLYPPAAAVAWRVVDFTQWSRLSWFIANLLVVLLLISARFWPELYNAWCDPHRQRRTAGLGQPRRT